VLKEVLLVVNDMVLTVYQGQHLGLSMTKLKELVIIWLMKNLTSISLTQEIRMHLNSGVKLEITK
jgi:hypothetical protein